jgi:hypothetical protein
MIISQFKIDKIKKREDKITANIFKGLTYIFIYLYLFFMFYQLDKYFIN